MVNLISEHFIEYLKNLTNFIIICQLFQISLKDLEHYTKNLQVKELILIFHRIDALIEGILKIFEHKNFCLSSRLLQSMVYQLFIDLLKIYQSYYLLVSYLLSIFNELSYNDMKRAWIIYSNFVKINKEIRIMAAIIIKQFDLKIEMTFYEVEAKVLDNMKQKLDQMERKRGRRSDDSEPNHTESSHT